jgi:hypothetical protein
MINTIVKTDNTNKKKTDERSKEKRDERQRTRNFFVE